MVERTTHAVLRRRGIAAMLLGVALGLGIHPAAWAASGIVRQSIQEIFPTAKNPNAKANVKPAPDAPVTIEADSMGYDKDAQIVVAVGNVVVVQGDYVLRADKLTYFQRMDRVEAQGNVSVLQPSGDVYFADKAQLNEGIKTGVIQAFQARLSDNSVLAANDARKESAAVTVLNKAVYSPCKICEGVAPFWQLKSGDMRIDEAKEKITYHDTQLEMFGVPAFYSPYLSGPTPNAEAQSGILTPTYSSGGNLGTNVKIPYYWRIADNKDVTLTPWFFSNDNPLLEADYRQLTDHGHYSIQLSGTDAQKFDSTGAAVAGTQFRGAVSAQGEESVADYSRVGFDINRSSDQTYLQRYGIGGGENGVLFSRVYAESAVQRNYASIEGLGIQGLRTTDNRKTTPQVAPTLDGYYETTPLENGMRFHVAGNAQSLMRETGANQRRLSVTTGASYPYVTDNGQVINASTSLRQDLYDVDHVTLAGGSNFNGTEERTIPQGALQWRYPFVRALGSGAMTIEPIILGVAQPNSGNPPQIENEDSRALELSDTNLFDIDRVPGYDVVDSGGRLAYGLRSEYMLSGGEAIDALLGQNYSFDNNTPFPNSTKAGTNASDIIGRFGFTVRPIIIAYRFAVGENDGSLNRSSLSGEFTKPWLDWVLAYNSVKNNSYIPNSEEIYSKATVPLTDVWKVYASGTRDLELDRMTYLGGGIIFHNECFDFTLDGLRDYTQDRDVGPSTSVTFRVGFKNLGVFGG
ncbi:MAG: hypothetical protein B7X02_00735 [Rhodospirillales bacterium 12-54-5]|nr:MAG: hypothetical protein B7X02_00735 [Rhodospirillales bacterium 12-54-5]